MARSKRLLVAMVALVLALMLGVWASSGTGVVQPALADDGGALLDEGNTWQEGAGDGADAWDWVDPAEEQDEQTAVDDAGAAADDAASEAATAGESPQYQMTVAGDHAALTVVSGDYRMINVVAAAPEQASDLEAFVERIGQGESAVSYAYALDPSASLPPVLSPGQTSGIEAPLYAASYFPVEESGSYGIAAALLYAGYPCDATGLMAAYGVDAWQAYASTQDALWALQSGYETTGDPYADALLDFALNGSVPDGAVTVTVYTAVSSFGNGTAHVDMAYTEVPGESEDVDASLESESAPEADEDIAASDNDQADMGETVEDQPAGGASPLSASYSDLIAISVDWSAAGQVPDEQGASTDEPAGLEDEQAGIGDGDPDEPDAQPQDDQAEQGGNPDDATWDGQEDQAAGWGDQPQDDQADQAAGWGEQPQDDQGTLESVDGPGAQDDGTIEDGAAEGEATEDQDSPDGQPQSELSALLTPTSWPVELSSFDAATGEGVGGAVFEIRENTVDATVSAQWDTTFGMYALASLVPGEYVLVETNVPQGYAKVDDIPFTVAEDGSIIAGDERVESIAVLHRAAAEDEQAQGQEPEQGEGPEGQTPDQGENPEDQTPDPGAIDQGAGQAAGSEGTDGQPPDQPTAENDPGAAQQPTDQATEQTTEDAPIDLPSDDSDGDSILDRIRAEGLDAEPAPADGQPAGAVDDEQASDAEPGSGEPGNEPAAAGEDPAATGEGQPAEDAGEDVAQTLPVTIRLHDSADPDLLVEGAVLQLFDASETPVAEWTTSAEPFVVDLTAGTYRVHEVASAQGYYPITNDVTFELADGYTEQTVLIGILKMPAVWSVAFAKADAQTGEALAGATLRLERDGAYAGGELVEEWQTDGSDHLIELGAGDYVLRETTVPGGYEAAADMLVSVSEEGDLVVDGQPATAVTMLDAPIPPEKFDVTVSLLDAADDAPLAGGSFQLLAHDGALVDEWVPDGTPHVTSLVAGTYTLRETAAPAGFDPAGDTEFSVDKNLTVTVRNSKTPPATWPVAYQLVDETGAGIAHAGMQVLDATGAAVDTWTTDGSAHRGKLEAGSYALRLAAVPNGYEQAADIAFTVGADGSIAASGQSATGNGAVTMVLSASLPSAYRVSVLKVDAATGNALAGAQLQVLDEGGKQVTIWTSNLQAHTAILAPGNYSLHELQAPSGYTRASDVPFTVAKDGTVSSTAGNAVVDGAVVMRDTPTQPATVSTFSVPIKKVDATSGAPISGAQLKVVDSAGSVVTTWTTDGNPAPSIVILPAGRYTLIESIAPQGYDKANNIAFSVASNGVLSSSVDGAVVDGVLVMRDRPGGQVPASGDDTPIGLIAGAAAAGVAVVGAGIALVVRSRKK